MFDTALWTEWFGDLLTEVMDDGPALVVRTIAIFITVLIVVRWGGKRSVGHLAPWDLALVILIGEIAAIPVADLKVHLTHGILPVLVIGLLYLALTTINLYSRRFEEWTEGRPTPLVKDGKVLKQNLRKERISQIDLESALRLKDVDDVSTVKMARMEPGGGISVVLKRDDSAATNVDLEEAVEAILQANAIRMRRELAELLRQLTDKKGG